MILLALGFVWGFVHAFVMLWIAAQNEPSWKILIWAFLWPITLPIELIHMGLDSHDKGAV